MVIARNYHIQAIHKINTIINHDPPCCPVCGRNLVGFGYRTRTYREWMTFPTQAAASDSGLLPGDELRIRRLYCPDCRQIHHELPIDMIRHN